jgi:nicotinate-nucleotide adenylyltransferase
VGHLRLAEEAVEELRLERCLFIPAWVPPHKPQSGIVSYDHRYRMLDLALTDNPHFLISDLERRLAGKSYTVPTLKQLHMEMKTPVSLHFLLGLDAFLEIHCWWHFRELFELARLVILRRPGYDRQAVADHLVRHVSPRYRWDEELRCFSHPELEPVLVLRSTLLDISSSAIRRLLANEKSARYLVPDPVLSYIKDTGLYGKLGDH